jgi:hypothetical protein
LANSKSEKPTATGVGVIFTAQPPLRVERKSGGSPPYSKMRFDYGAGCGMGIVKI